jgi:hypothetical protein
MRAENDISALLAAAREVLRTDLMPELSGDARYRAAMIANAMAIAMRAAKESGRLESVEEIGLAAVYPRRAGEAIDMLRRRLIADIRSGSLDEAGKLLTERLLRPRVRACLTISNPEYRGGREFS